MNPAANTSTLVPRGKVTRLPSARVYAVKDAHGSYIVTLLVRSTHCSCPARGDCSHAQTAELQARAELGSRRGRTGALIEAAPSATAAKTPR